MRTTAQFITAASAVATLIGALTLVPTVVAAADGKPKTAFEQGKEIAFSNKKGNCLSCHYIEGGELPGTIGPALVAMKDRFPQKAKLRAQIFDASKNNSETMMPPFGRHAILSEEEIKQVIEFI